MNFISQNIKYLVEKSKISKDALGFEFGLNRGTIGSYISGKAKPKIETIIQISDYFSITTDDLLKKDLAEQGGFSTSAQTVNEKKAEQEEMGNEFLEQLSKLVDAHQKAMEGMNKQMEMNMKLVEMLHERQTRPDYMGKLTSLEERHDKIEEKFNSLFDKFEELEKKEEIDKAAGYE